MRYLLAHDIDYGHECTSLKAAWEKSWAHSNPNFQLSRVITRKQKFFLHNWFLCTKHNGLQKNNEKFILEWWKGAPVWAWNLIDQTALLYQRLMILPTTALSLRDLGSLYQIDQVVYQIGPTGKHSEQSQVIQITWIFRNRMNFSLTQWKIVPTNLSTRAVCCVHSLSFLYIATALFYRRIKKSSLQCGLCWKWNKFHFYKKSLIILDRYEVNK